MNLFPADLSQQYKLVQEIERQIAVRIPKFKVVCKQQSWLMKVLAVILYPFNRKFMTSYTTTIYPVVYWNGSVPAITDKSTEGEVVHYLDVLLHEFRHLIDRKKYWILFNLMYLFPQLLAVFALLSIFFSPWFLLALAALAPLPAVGRMWLERRAFDVTMAVYSWMGFGFTDEYVDHIVGQFVGSSYYFMWPFRNQLKKHFNQIIEDLKNKKLNNSQQEIYTFFLDSLAAIDHT